MQYEALAQHLRAAGCFPGTPRRSALALIDGVTLDRESTERSTCEACGQPGMQYESWTDRAGAYRHAVAWCPRCQEAYTF